jgi:hypothetical protein
MCEATIDLHDHRYLPNGALILLEREGQPAYPGTYRTTIVLAKTTTEFVVWTCVHPPDEPDFCIHGSYWPLDIEHLRQALDTYEQRLA